MLYISLKHGTEWSWEGRLEVGITVKAKGNTASELEYREKKTGWDLRVSWHKKR